LFTQERAAAAPFLDDLLGDERRKTGMPDEAAGDPGS
jgi:hypothetical protein